MDAVSDGLNISKPIVLKKFNYGQVLDGNEFSCANDDSCRSEEFRVLYLDVQKFCIDVWGGSEILMPTNIFLRITE